MIAQRNMSDAITLNGSIFARLISLSNKCGTWSSWYSTSGLGKSIFGWSVPAGAAPDAKCTGPKSKRNPAKRHSIVRIKMASSELRGFNYGRGKAVRVPSGVLYSERKNVNREWLCSLFAGSDASLVVSHEQNAVTSTCILKETLPPHLDLRGAQVGALS